MILGPKLRSKWPYAQWPARHKNPEKMGKKMKNGPEPEMAEKWPPKWKNGLQNGILANFWDMFPFPVNGEIVL